MNEAYPSNKTVFVGDTVEFQCKFISDMQPSMRWLRFVQVNGSWTDENNVSFIEKVQVISPVYVSVE